MGRVDGGTELPLSSSTVWRRRKKDGQLTFRCEPGPTARMVLVLRITHCGQEKASRRWKKHSDRRQKISPLSSPPSQRRAQASVRFARSLDPTTAKVHSTTRR